MPKNKFQEVIFTIIMATIMVYGMVVYNVALNTGGVTGQTFLLALHELPILSIISIINITLIHILDFYSLSNTNSGSISHVSSLFNFK